MYDPAARHNSPVAKFTGELPDTEPKWVWVDGGKPEKARHGRCDGQRLHNLWMGRAICLHPEPGDRDPYWAAERVCSLPRSCDRAEDGHGLARLAVGADFGARDVRRA